MSNFLTKLSLFILIISALTNCNIYRPTDTRKVPVNVTERAQKNIQEGKGFKIFDSQKSQGGGTFEFATSNELWRATINILDFVPLANVEYSGGIIITDWYQVDQTENTSIKISVRFLTNEIRSDALEVSIFKKTCNQQINCATSKLNSNLSDEIKKEILSQATRIKENQPLVKPDFKFPGIDR
jgi:hypothetical protein